VAELPAGFSLSFQRCVSAVGGSTTVDVCGDLPQTAMTAVCCVSVAPGIVSGSRGTVTSMVSARGGSAACGEPTAGVRVKARIVTMRKGRLGSEIIVGFSPGSSAIFRFASGDDKGAESSRHRAPTRSVGRCAVRLSRERI
jgi:hypothetical protein